MQIYNVGGSVRDMLLGIDNKDRDYVVVGADVDIMLNTGFLPVGKDFPVFLHPETYEQYALARTEKKTGLGYKGFTMYADKNVTLKEDLFRRDLTINALAQDLNGNIIDYYGGLADLKHKTLKHISDAFREDPLRVLRLARFAARFYSLGFKIAEATMSLCETIVNSGELKFLSGERVWQETLKALNTDNPEIYFAVLHNCGALQELFTDIALLYQSRSSTIALVLQRCVSMQVTDEVKWASCIYASSISIEADINLSNQYKLPTSFKELNNKLLTHAASILNWHNLSSIEKLNLLDSLDYNRRTHRVLQILEVLSICTLHNFEHTINIVTKLKSLNISEITSKYSGKEISIQIRELKLATIDNVL